MDRLVQFSGNGPTKIINASKVMWLEQFSTGRAVAPYTAIMLDGGTRITVAGTLKEVAVALGGVLVVFEPLSGLLEAPDATQEGAAQ